VLPAQQRDRRRDRVVVHPDADRACGRRDPARLPVASLERADLLGERVRDALVVPKGQRVVRADQDDAAALGTEHLAHLRQGLRHYLFEVDRAAHGGRQGIEHGTLERAALLGRSRRPQPLGRPVEGLGQVADLVERRSLSMCRSSCPAPIAAAAAARRRTGSARRLDRMVPRIIVVAGAVPMNVAAWVARCTRSA